MAQLEHQQTTPPPAPQASAAASMTVPPAATAAKSTRRHWRALRNALCSKPAAVSGDATASAISTAFFPVFQAKRPSAQAAASSSSSGDSVAASTLPSRVPEEGFEWVHYDASVNPPRGTATPHVVFVHEKQNGKKVTIAELLSHKVNEGVDNTGNVRTWPSEQLLLSFLLKNDVCQRLYESRGGATPLNCCELGSGMAGLASLGLLAHGPVPFGRFDVTDGNPLSVQNLKICVDENVALGTFAKSSTNSTRINVNLLRWNRNAHFTADELHQFDLLLASDCLFFEEFHVDLAYTVKQLLKPGSGRCFMLQPSRNGSMERFVAIAQNHGLHVERCDDFDPEVAQKHASYLASRPDYVPDVHLPILLTVSSQSSCS